MPFTNLYSLPILGPEIIENESSISEISTEGFSSISEIFIVNITDSVILIFLVETDEDISCEKTKLINDKIIKKALTILFHFH